MMVSGVPQQYTATKKSDDRGPGAMPKIILSRLTPSVITTWQEWGFQKYQSMLDNTTLKKFLTFSSFRGVVIVFNFLFICFKPQVRRKHIGANIENPFATNWSRFQSSTIPLKTIRIIWEPRSSCRRRRATAPCRCRPRRRRPTKTTKRMIPVDISTMSSSKSENASKHWIGPPKLNL